MLMVLLGGLQWMVSGGNEDMLARAKRTVGNAIIGMIIILLAWAIVRFVLDATTAVLEPPSERTFRNRSSGATLHMLCLSRACTHSHRMQHSSAPSSQDALLRPVAACLRLRG